MWVAAAAKAATEVLLGMPFEANQTISLPENGGSLIVSVKSASLLEHGRLALAITYCDPGLILDLTRGLEIWTIVCFEDTYGQTNDVCFDLLAGFGVGRFKDTGDPCVSNFARQLIDQNLKSLVKNGSRLKIELVLPAGKELAERTSNSAFGIVDGLSLIGTQAQVQSSASPDQLKETLQELKNRCAEQFFEGQFIFVIGENGFDLALKSGLPKNLILKTGNWLGPLIVAAAENGIKNLLLFGYHGKLVKLAGGIFHTHHHLADGRLEILTYLAVRQKLPSILIERLGDMTSMEEALRMMDTKYPDLVPQLWLKVASEIEERSRAYLSRYIDTSMEIGTVLFDRPRNLRWAGPLGLKYLNSLGGTLQA